MSTGQKNSKATPDISKKYFKFVLRRMRKMLDMTMDEVADKAGISKSYYSMLEYGRKIVNVDMVFALAKAFDVSPAELINALDLEYQKRKKPKDGEQILS